MEEGFRGKRFLFGEKENSAKKIFIPLTGFRSRTDLQLKFVFATDTSVARFYKIEKEESRKDISLRLNFCFACDGRTLRESTPYLPRQIFIATSQACQMTVRRLPTLEASPTTFTPLEATGAGL